MREWGNGGIKNSVRTHAGVRTKSMTNKCKDAMLASERNDPVNFLDRHVGVRTK